MQRRRTPTTHLAWGAYFVVTICKRLHLWVTSYGSAPLPVSRPHNPYANFNHNYLRVSDCIMPFVML